MLWIELLIVVMAIYLGSRLGGIGIGFAGGMGVLMLTLGCQLKPGNIPFDVIEIIMSVIAAIAAMQMAGGMDYLVNLAERFLRKNPRYITLFAPLVTYCMTLMAGTGHTSFSTLPVIAEVAKEAGIRPSRPLSVAVIASQVAITASPISAAVVFLSGTLEPLGIGYLAILGVMIPSTMVALLVTALITNFLGKELRDDPICQACMAASDKKALKTDVFIPRPGAKRAVVLFLLGIITIVLYATAISDTVKLMANPVLPRNEAIVVLMLAVATLICFSCKVNTSAILNASTFRAGMSACICVLGVAWLGDTFIKAHIDSIRDIASDVLIHAPWMLAIVLFISSMLLYSQAATAKALIPAALALGVAPVTVIASFAATSALFVLPTYPTLLAAVEMDSTGSTRIGKYVFNHSFIIPGVLAILFSVLFSFLLSHQFL